MAKVDPVSLVICDAGPLIHLDEQRTKRQILNLLRAVPRRSTLFIDPRLLNFVIEEVKNA